VRREVEANLEAIARLKVDQIVQWRAERLGDAGVLMGSQFFAEGVQRWLGDPQADLAEKILARLRSMQQHNRYSNVLLVDARGQVRLGASGPAATLHSEGFPALATALQEQRPVLTDLHVGPADLPPHADLIAPLFQQTGATLQPIGAVVLTIDARQFLYPLIQSWPTASRSAETLLVRREGDDILFLNDLRHRPDAAFKLRIPLTRQEVAAVMAALGKEGVFHGTDYRGAKVLSVLKRIPDTSWSMVAKMDETEALAEWRFRANLIVAVIVALVLAVTARTIWEQRKKYRALSESAAALREVELRYRTLFVQSPVGVVTVDLQSGLTVEFNDLAARQLGYSREEFARLRIGDYEAHETPEQTRAHIERLLREGADEFETRHRTKTGEIRDVLVTTRAMKLNGHVLANSVFQDVTERKRAEEEIRRVNRGLKVLSEANQLLVRATEESQLLRDMCTILVDVGGYRFAWVGFAEDDSSKAVRPVAWAGHEDGYLRAVRITWADDGRGRGPIGTAIRTGETQLITDILYDERFEPWRDEANARGYRSLVALPLFDAGQPFGALAIYSAMSDAFDAEEVKLLKELADDLAHGVGALRARAARLQAEQRRHEEAEVSGALARIGGELLASLNTGPMLDRLCQVITEVLRCDYCATATWRPDAAGYTPTAAYGLPQEFRETIRSLTVADAGLGYQRERLEKGAVVQLLTSAVDSPFARLALQHGITRSLFVALKRGEENLGLVAAGFCGRTDPFTTTQERIAAGAGQLTSIALEHSLVMDALERANRLKSDFVATMSHELRTPMNIIMGYNDLMIDEVFGPLTVEQADTLQRTQKSAGELLELINATLDISRLEAGTAPLNVEEVDIRDMLEGLRRDASRFGGEPRGEPSVTVAWDIASPLPRLRTDGVKLKVIVKNLISNALKFTGHGRVTIAAQARKDGVEISVADTGGGIAEDVLPIIFEPFRQGESAMTRRYGGVGLGLYIVKRLLELLGGTITVDSEVGRGSTFRVWLPVKQVQRFDRTHAATAGATQ
jgi:PAS domain S-box-containing protein